MCESKDLVAILINFTKELTLSCVLSKTSKEKDFAGTGKYHSLKKLRNSKVYSGNGEQFSKNGKIDFEGRGNTGEVD